MSSASVKFNKRAKSIGNARSRVVGDYTVRVREGGGGIPGNALLYNDGSPVLYNDGSNVLYN